MSRRAVASIVLAGALALGLSGCVFITPQATLYQYDPGNGVGTKVGDVEVRDALALTNEDGSAVSLLITFVNNGSRSVTVNLQFDSAGEKTTEEIHVNGDSVKQFGNTAEQDQLVILEPGVPAGSLMPVYVQYGDNEGTTLLVPVLEGNLPEYEDLMPETPSE